MGQFPNKETQFKRGDNMVTNRDIKVRAGSVKSPAKRLGAYKRIVSQLGLTPKIVEKAKALILDPEMSYTDWYKNIQWLEDAVGDDPNYQGMLAGMKRDWNKAVHGDRSAVQVNVQNNNYMTAEEKDELVKRLMKEED